MNKEEIDILNKQIITFTKLKKEANNSLKPNITNPIEDILTKAIQSAPILSSLNLPQSKLDIFKDTFTKTKEYQEAIKKVSDTLLEYINNRNEKKVLTVTQESKFDYEINFNDNNIPEECFYNLEILKKRLLRKKENNYDDPSVMMHDFISNLNDCYMYFNDFLIKLAIKNGLATPDIFGKGNGHGGYVNDINILLKSIEERLKSSDSDLYQKVKEIRYFFNIYGMIIRNNYSHGWLDIFNVLILNNQNNSKDSPVECFYYNPFHIRYDINDNGLFLVLKIYDTDFFEHIKHTEQLLTESNTSANEASSFVDISVHGNLVRNVIKEFSINSTKNENGLHAELKYFPKCLNIYSNNKVLPDLEISENSFFKHINNFFEIIDMTNKKGLIKL